MALISRISTSAAVVAIAGGAAASIIGLGAGAASAVVGENIPDSCLQYSQDGGATWSTSSVIEWKTVVPVPGDINDLHASFKARNNCETPAKLQVYAGNWSVTPNGSATIHATLNSNTGDTTTLQSGAGHPGITVNETKRLAKDQAVDVKLYIGIPQSETAQGFDINPDWSLGLEEVAPTDPAEPTNGSGNPGGGNTGGSGSLNTGSLGTGSLGGNRAGLTVKVHSDEAVNNPTVRGNIQ